MLWGVDVYIHIWNESEHEFNNFCLFIFNPNNQWIVHIIIR
jgi:hypothetical protein